MDLSLTRALITVVVGIFAAILSALSAASADSASSLERDSRRALNHLYRTAPGASKLGEEAAGVLVFPSILKGGFLVAAQYGRGVLFKRGAVAGYYSTASASFGLQAGAQKFGYALFFMREADLRYLDSSEGWELGLAPGVTVVDWGVAHSLSTTSARSGVYAFFFGHKGLMGGLSVQGTKISRIKPD